VILQGFRIGQHPVLSGQPHVKSGGSDVKTLIKSTVQPAAFYCLGQQWKDSHN